MATLAQNSLNTWMQALVDYVRSGEPDLTNRQMALLLVVYLRPGPHTVRGLARCLNVSKPVVTRALNRLGRWAICAASATTATSATSSSRARLKGQIFLKSSAILSTKGPCPTSTRLPRKTFALAGPRVALDPRTHAVRRDLADVRLAEQVFAPHYSESVERIALREAVLRESPAADAATLAELKAGDPFDLLDVTGSTAWGIATRHGLVGYVDADALGSAPAEEAA